MSRRLVATLAVGLAVGFLTVSGAAALGSGGPAATPAATGAPAATDAQTADGTTIDTENGTLTLDAAPNQTVAGETDLAPGTSLTVRLRSSGNSTPFLRTADATVSDDGTWTASVDLSSVADQPRFTAIVIRDGEELANVTGQVVGEPTDPLGEVDPSASENRTLVGASDDSPPPANATFAPENGSLELANGSAQRVTGQTDLAPGSRVTVRLVSTGASPFLRTTRTVVTENGTFGVAFDLSNVPAGESFEARARYDGERIGNRTGVVTECQDDCSATVEPWLTEEIVFTQQDASVTTTLNLLDDTDEATLVVGSEETSFRLEALVRDTDDDGLVTVSLDPAAAGTETPTLTAEGEDAATIKVEAALAPPLDPTDYDLTLYRGDDTDSQPVDVGTLVVTAPDENASAD
jgi:hypothetical protein